MEAQSAFRAGIPDPCVLLGGQPRSGTTLLSSILRSTAGHLQGFEIHMRKPSFVVGLEGRYTRRIFEQIGLPPAEYDAVLEQTDTSTMNLGAWVGPKEEVSAEPLSGRETNNFQQELHARGELVTRLMRRTAELHGLTTWGFKVLGDIIYADCYTAVWPNCKWLLLIRDPRDQAMSIMKLNEQREARNQPVFYDTCSDAVRGWRDTIIEARRVLRKNNLSFLELRYEDLVVKTDETVDQLSSFLGLDVKSGLDFNRRDFVETHTQRFRHHDNLKNPINAGSVGKWKSAMDERERDVFVEEAGDLMSQLGYL